MDGIAKQLSSSHRKKMHNFFQKMSHSQIVKNSPLQHASEMKDTLMRLKEEFDQKYNNNEVSSSCEKLIEYKFIAILGQGAFGLVVSCLTVVSLSPLNKYSALFF